MQCFRPGYQGWHTKHRPGRNEGRRAFEIVILYCISFPYKVAMVLKVVAFTGILALVQKQNIKFT